MVDNSQAHHLMTAAMIQIMIPVASPPRNAPTSAAIFDVSGSLASCGSGATVGLGCNTGSSEATVGRGSSACGSEATVERGFSTGGSGIEVVGLGPSICGSSVEVVGLGPSICGSSVEVVGVGCVSGVQEGLHTLTMVAV